MDQFALLLRCVPAFDKVALGLFLAEPDPWTGFVRSTYCMQNFDFGGQTVDDALRMFLEAFRLPLEAQQIDRCMASFAETYHGQNPRVLANADAVHTLSLRSSCSTPTCTTSSSRTK